MAKIITLTTDFGIRDSYVGALKGALLSVNPEAVIVDISHTIEPGNIKEGAFVIAGAYSYYPVGTIHVGVVDPGVGGQRKALLVETERHFFVGPDNGLFTFALGRESIVRSLELKQKRYFRDKVSSTFHGRDIFAPVAAHLSLGVEPSAFGTRLASCIALDSPTPKFTNSALSGEVIYGEVIYIDNFGNLITSIREEDLTARFKGTEADRLRVEVKGVEILGVCSTYADRGSGEGVALIGSSGYLEVAINGGSSVSYLNIGLGEKVSVSVSVDGTPTKKNFTKKNCNGGLK